jgi:hypothetical protein
MNPDKDRVWQALRKTLGVNSPPTQITQEPFDGDISHLRRLARLEPGEQAVDGDLTAYYHDLLYTDIQSDLFAHMLPMLLAIWHNDLRGIDDIYGGFVDWFYLVLARPNIFQQCFTSRQTTVVSEFIQKTILDEIDGRRGLSFQGSRSRPYNWFRALTSYGVIFPDIARVWNSWWSVGTTGRAVAAVQYVSCLMYSKYENPVFSPWTPNGGGGPPCLWEYAGHLYKHRWLQSNVEFLAIVLNPTVIVDLLGRAVAKLAGQPGYDKAAEVRSDLPIVESTLNCRCQKLPVLLGTINEPSNEFNQAKETWELA